jgi:GT2 family glycosyltransferase
MGQNNHLRAFAGVLRTRIARAAALFLKSSERRGAYSYRQPDRPPDLNDRISSLRARPFISVLTPVYNVDPVYLEAAISSVLSQWYPEWELILVDDASSRRDTRQFLADLDDPRIHVSFNEDNIGISATTNRALAVARGEYVVFLDHDDELTPDCLYELACEINKSSADYLYSDEDKIDTVGRFSSPFFKPDWSPDTLMSTMYTCHVSCMRRSLVLECGGLRSEYDGAQDYDLAVRLSERAVTIKHVPKVLYHWRTLPSSTALSLGAKEYVGEAARNLKEDALARRNLPGLVEAVPAMPGQFRINYLPQGCPSVSIIIALEQFTNSTASCLSSIVDRTNYKSFEIILVSGQAERLRSRLSQHEKVQAIVAEGSPSRSRLNNVGAGRASGDVLIFLDQAAEATSSDWLVRLVGYAQREHVGAVGAQHVWPNGRIRDCGIVNLPGGPQRALTGFPTDKAAYFGRNVLEYNWMAVSESCLAIERRKFEALGGFNDRDFPILGDVDLCIRLIESGSFNVACQAVRFQSHRHPLDIRYRFRDIRRKRVNARAEICRLHPDYCSVDPFYHRNLNQAEADFRIRMEQAST